MRYILAIAAYELIRDKIVFLWYYLINKGSE